jgi:hypothetical protein
MLHIKAAVAEEQRRVVSQRTREALAAAKERGVVMGNQKQADANKAAAAARDAGLLDLLMEIGWEQPYQDIAEQLTERGVPTPRGGVEWNAITVMRMLKRLCLRQNDRWAGSRLCRRYPRTMWFVLGFFRGLLGGRR